MKKIMVFVLLALGLSACKMPDEGVNCGWIFCDEPPTECDGNCSGTW